MSKNKTNTKKIIGSDGYYDEPEKFVKSDVIKISIGVISVIAIAFILSKIS